MQKTWQPLLLWNSGLIVLGLTGCQVANEYTSQAEAIEVAQTRKPEIVAIGGLPRDFQNLWVREDQLEAWKQEAIPVFENAGVTTAQLMYRSRTLNPSKPLSKKILYTRVPASELTQGGGGWIPVPSRFAISGSLAGTITSSRGRCSLYGQKHTLYAYDFFGEDSDYWLRVVFWDPLPLTAQ